MSDNCLPENDDIEKHSLGPCGDVACKDFGKGCKHCECNPANPESDEYDGEE